MIISCLRHAFLQLCLLWLFCASGIAQCIDYPTIEDAFCVACTPPGWTIAHLTPDVTNPDFICPTIPASPGGGNAAHFFGHPTLGGEASETTVTGLVPGQDYYLAFWYVSANCRALAVPPVCCAEFELIVDGDSNIFETQSDWTLAELCVTATSDEMHIITAGHSSGPIGQVLVDDAECDFYFCCIPEEPEFDFELSYCQNDPPLNFPKISLEGIEGTWDIDPFNPADYSDENVTVRFSPDNNPGCDEEIEIEVYVHGSKIPEFDFPLEYCHTYTEYLTLPTLSENNITGTWDIPFFEIANYIDDDVEVTFTPDGLSCSEELKLTIEFKDVLELEFELADSYCQQQKEINLPILSKSGVEGWWTDNPIKLDKPAGDYELVFIADPTLTAECFAQYTYSYSIVEEIHPQFQIDTSICRTDQVITLDPYSVDSIIGSWTNPQFIPDTITGSQLASTWLPLEQSSCITDTSLIFQLTNPMIPYFELPTTLCESDAIVIFPEYSQVDSIHGSWTIPDLDPKTSAGNIITNAFIPDDSLCAEPIQISIDIHELLTPTFSLPQVLCLLDQPLELPDTSLNGLTGTWTTNPIDPSLSISLNESSTFIPNDPCIDYYILNVEIEPSQILNFDLPVYLCSTAEDLILPKESTNGISGNWTIEVLTPSQFSNAYFTSTFVPNTDYCANPFTYTAYIQGPLTWQLEQINPSNCTSATGQINFTSADPQIEYTLDNINWLNQNSTQLSAGIYEVKVRSKLYPACVETMEVSLSSPESPEITATPLVHISSCLQPNGQITVEAKGQDLEYSIDGINWQASNRFENLGQGDYLILVRERNSDCQIQSTVTINGIAEVKIIDAIPTNPTSCIINDGSLEIIANGPDLEYSLDNTNWQNDPEFKDLAPGVYEVYVRNKLAKDCEDKIILELVVPEFPVIIDVTMTPVTSCQNPNGTITIIASGNDLEYSINNGMTWAQNNFFDLLSEGDYIIVIRSISSLDCEAHQSITIPAIESVTIINVETTNPSECDPTNGSISVDATGNNLEYSIDDGVTYQNSGLFKNLKAGSYSIRVQDAQRTDCNKKTSTLLDLEIDSLPIPQFTITPPSDCHIQDATIIVYIDSTNVSYSLDLGINWQGNNDFYNLAAGDYIIMVRHNDYLACTSSVNLTIPKTECPCEDLNILISTTPVYCLDEDNGTISIDEITGYKDSIKDILWDNGLAGRNLENLKSGWHTYTVAYDLNCEWSDSVFVVEIEPLTFGLKTFDPDCEGLNDGVIEIVDIEGGNGGFNYSLNEMEYQEENIFYNLSPQEYLVHVTDDQNCIKTDLVNINEGLALSLELPEVEAIEQGEKVFLNPLINEETIDSFYWSPNAGITNIGELVAEVQPEETTQYTLVVYFGNCSEIRNITVNVNTTNDEVYLANSFSLNTTGMDRFIFPQTKENSNIVISFLRIYDRWGNLVFDKIEPRANEPSDGWDGMIRSKPAVSGVYVYVIEYVINGKTHLLANDLTLY